MPLWLPMEHPPISTHTFTQVPTFPEVTVDARARSVALPMALAVLAGCAREHVRHGVQQDPSTVEAAGESAFARYQIPVLERSLDRRVRSGSFDVHRVWDPSTVAARVQCGADGYGDPAAGAEGDIRLSVELRLSPNRVALSSSGSQKAPEGEGERRCRLTDAFAEELLGAIVGEPPPALGGRGRPGEWVPQELMSLLFDPERPGR